MLVACAVAAGIAIALALIGRPTTLRHEAVPPEVEASGQLGIDTPTLEGPDALELAPLVALTTTGFAFDHEPVDRFGLESRLRTYRANYPLLHPGETAPREVLLACSPTVSSERVFAVLETVRSLGFDRARLVFERVRRQGPTSEGKQPPRITAALVSIAVEAAPLGEERRVRESDIENCSQLSERVVALRRASLPVTLVLRAGD